MLIAKHSLTGIWLLLLAATMISGFLGIETAMGTLVSAAMLLAISFLKALAVLSEFMELRRAPTVWKLLTTAWLVAVIATIFAGYVLGNFGTK